jgi:drug/metabolite transporter (DMT)-like permease
VTPVVLLLVLVAAGLHAGWNVLLKTSGDPLEIATRSLAASALVVTPFCLVAWLATGHRGLPAAGWVILAASACSEGLYFVFLSRAYQAGDLSSVYPVARGTGPLVAVTAGLLVLRERLTIVELAGVGALLAGIWAVRGRQRLRMDSAVVPALITGLFIGAYTTLDRVGINLGSPWLYGGLLWGLMAVFLAAWTRGRPFDGTGGRGGTWGRSIAIGLMMAIAYGLALVALTLAPVAIVAPLRESAIVLVTLWGVWQLKEREGVALRVAGAVAILAGIVLIAL